MGLFNRNTVTGLVRSTYRDYTDMALYVTLQLPDSTITLEVRGDLADQIETVLIARKRRQETTTLTLEYTPATGEIIGFSVVS